MTDSVTTFQAPQGIRSLTQTVFDDEPCFHLAELNRLQEGGKELGRYQSLQVVRDDRLVTAYVYLGPTSQFQADEFQVPGGALDDQGRGYAVHTVAELQEIAEYFRNEPVRRELEPWDLDAAYKNHVEERMRAQRHQSTFGSHIALTRN